MFTVSEDYIRILKQNWWFYFSELLIAFIYWIQSVFSFPNLRNSDIFNWETDRTSILIVLYRNRDEMHLVQQNSRKLGLHEFIML